MEAPSWDPELAPYLEALGQMLPKPAHEIGAGVFREMLARANPLRPELRPSGLSVRDTVAKSGARDVLLRLYRPAGLEGGGALLFFHGGGWTVGSVDSYDLIAAEIALKADCSVISVDYALAPENPYPAAMEDAVAAHDWLRDNAGQLGIARDRIAIGGDSAGGQLAAGLCLWLRDERRITPFVLQWLLYPALDANSSRPSAAANENAPVLPRATLDWFWRNYLGSEVASPPVYAAPLSAADLAGLPPAFISVAGCDPLHDEGVEWAHRLRQAGIPAELSRQPTLVHGHIRARAMSRLAREEFDASCHFLGRELRKGGSAVSAAD